MAQTLNPTQAFNDWLQYPLPETIAASVVGAAVSLAGPDGKRRVFTYIPAVNSVASLSID